MSAQNYKLCVSGLMGTPFIAKVSKTNPNLMLQDRRKIDDTEFMIAIEHWAKARLKDGSKDLEIKDADGKLIYTISFA